jgi:hypothetical protein
VNRSRHYNQGIGNSLINESDPGDFEDDMTLLSQLVSDWTKDIIQPEPVKRYTKDEIKELELKMKSEGTL